MQAVDGTLVADAGRLTQVIRNLVRNAVTHTHPGDSIELVATAHDDRLQIAVIDSGPGIPPDQLEQIFERFHRVERSRSRDRGGTGLGLPIARAIVEAHGGWIRAEQLTGTRGHPPFRAARLHAAAPLGGGRRCGCRQRPSRAAETGRAAGRALAA